MYQKKVVHEVDILKSSNEANFFMTGLMSKFFEQLPFLSKLGNAINQIVANSLSKTKKITDFFNNNNICVY